MHLTSYLSTVATCFNIAYSLQQTPLLQHAYNNRTISSTLFNELEELARIVDITYCVGLTSLGISKPFSCLSHCSDFPQFELVTAWNTGPLLSDSCGYIALDHGKQRIIVAFRGTYSIANTVVDLSTVSQEYVPFPGADEDEVSLYNKQKDFSKRINHRIHLTKRLTEDDVEPEKCENCTVHAGFYTSWLHTRDKILLALEDQMALFSDYQLNLVGHSLGGAIAALAALDFEARGWSPLITTFGEPRIGNANLVKFLDHRFELFSATDDDTQLQYRRVTHVDDPVPLLPLGEWGYTMHAGEIFISKPALSPDVSDIVHCKGDNDQDCIAGQDTAATSLNDADTAGSLVRKRDIIALAQDEINELIDEPWGIPSRYKLWQLFFAHRDYFWRLGLCVPGGDPLGGGRELNRDLR